MKTEVETLREEIAKLRERVAVLESAHMYKPLPVPVLLQPAYVPPPAPAVPWTHPFIVTCVDAQSGALQS